MTLVDGKYCVNMAHYKISTEKEGFIFQSIILFTIKLKWLQVFPFLQLSRKWIERKWFAGFWAGFYEKTTEVHTNFYYWIILLQSCAHQLVLCFFEGNTLLSHWKKINMGMRTAEWWLKTRFTLHNSSVWHDISFYIFYCCLSWKKLLANAIFPSHRLTFLHHITYIIQFRNCNTGNQ